MFLAFRDKGAIDWRSDLAISVDHSGSHHRLQCHPVFPEVRLKNHFTTREADDIANLAYIGGKTHRGISDKPPAQTLPPLFEQHGLTSFEAQAIPTDPGFVGVESYKDFLAMRRLAIAKDLNAFIGTPTASA